MGRGTERAGFEDWLVVVIQSERPGARRGGAREEGGGGAEGKELEGCRTRGRAPGD